MSEHDWRLPRQTGDLTADYEALRRARQTATTPDQRRACRVRQDQLFARSFDRLRSFAEAVSGAFRRMRTSTTRQRDYGRCA